MSWSIKILALYLGFVTLILTLVFTCFGHKTELEYKDYYAREISFQEQLDAQENARDLATPISHRVKDGVVELTFPGMIFNGISGSIELIRPSDAARDLVIPVQPGVSGKQVITGLSKGPYKMRVRFKQGGTNYFYESVITIR